jgi:acylphosphatase
VDAVLKACRQGPRGSVVERIEPVEDGGAENGPWDGFEVRETS